MRLYSYIVASDTGFSPNPFSGVCTLACCKPGIRRTATVGDWIVGLTPKSDGNRILYCMEVGNLLRYDQYWRRFKCKRPNLNGSLSERSGDNIYEPKDAAVGNRLSADPRNYRQLPSRHSKPKFSNYEDPDTKRSDLSGQRVLVATKFAYFGSTPQKLPKGLNDLIVGLGYRCNFSEETKEGFLEFVKKLEFGVHAKPTRWRKDDGSWKSTGC